MKKLYILFIIIVIVSGGLSCAYRYQPVIPEERILYKNEVNSIAVVPFVNMAEGKGDIRNATEIFSSELARFREVNIVHPTSVAQYLYEHNIKLDSSNITAEALKIGAFFNVDTVIVGTITEYNSFFPPIFGLSLLLIEVDTGKIIASRSEVYDSSFNYVRNELKTYASVKKLKDSLYEEDLILHRFELYIRFVCHQIIKKYF